MWREAELKQVLAYHYLNHMNVREKMAKKIQGKKLEGKKREKRVSGRADGALLLRLKVPYTSSLRSHTIVA
jgi:hypothetical protein